VEAAEGPHLALAAAVLDLVLAEAAEGQHEALAEAAVQRMGQGPDAGTLPKKREDRSATVHQRSDAPPPGAASDR
jgi:hypothetical protein